MLSFVGGVIIWDDSVKNMGGDYLVRCTKLFNRTWGVFLAAALIVPFLSVRPVNAAEEVQTVNITIGNISGAPGSTVEEPISINGVSSDVGMNKFQSGNKL